MHALIIDDSLAVQRISQGILLSSCNFDSVTLKNDGEAGLKEILENSAKYSLILLDWNMPLMDGIDVLLKVRDEHIQTPIIMSTSAGDRESIINAISAGANDYIVKPFRAMGLEEKVNKVLLAHEEKIRRSKEKRVLIVDDSNMFRIAIKKVLVKDGYFNEIILAENGYQALEIFHKGSLDLIILDWEMPGINGIEVLKVIRQKDKAIPIIMATSNSEIEHMVAAFDSGVSNFLPKPFSPNELLQKVHQQLLH